MLGYFALGHWPLGRPFSPLCAPEEPFCLSGSGISRGDPFFLFGLRYILVCVAAEKTAVGIRIDLLYSHSRMSLGKLPQGLSADGRQADE